MTDTQTIEQFEKSLIERSTQAFKHCMELWSKIGYNESQIFNRCNEINKYFISMYDDLITTEEFILEKIQQELEKYRKDLKKLQQGLNVELVKLNDSNNNDQIERNLDAVDCRKKQEISLKKNTMLEETEYYKKMINELSEIKKSRKEALELLKKREKLLCNILNESEYSISDTSCINQTDLENLEHHVNNLSMEKRQRISQLKEFCSEITTLINDYKLQVEPDSSLYHLISLREFDETEINQKIIAKQLRKLDAKNFERYRNSIGKLNLQKEELIQSIEFLRNDILNMWNKYDLKNTDLEDYILNLAELNQETYNKLHEEYSRCCNQKQTRIKKIICDKHQEFNNLIDVCFLDESIKIEIEQKLVKLGYTEEILDSLETYLENLHNYAIKYEKLFRILKEWTDVWQQFKDFEKAHMDPKRFHQRGYSSLNEQRERDSLKNKLSKLKQQLAQECDFYTKEEGRDFLINGQSIENYMDELKRDFDKEKENAREERMSKSGVNSLRKKSVIRNFLTPQNQNIRSSYSQKSLVSPSPSSVKQPMSSAKYSVSSQNSIRSNTGSIRIGLNFDATPNSSRILKSTPRKLMNPVLNLNDKKKSTTVTNLPQKHKRRSSIKELSEKYKKRRSKAPFENKMFNNAIIPEIFVSEEYKNYDFLANENESVLKTANMFNGESTHLTSSGIISGNTSVSGYYHL